MRILSQSQALAYLRQQKAPIEVRRALGDYQQDDNVGQRTNDVYDENSVFYAPGGSSGGVQITTPPIMQNINSFGGYPFVIGQASTTVLPQNMKRTLLLIQNQSPASNLYVNFSSDASPGNGILLTPGLGVFFDVNAPNNSISCFYDNITPQLGFIVEGSPTG